MTDLENRILENRIPDRARSQATSQDAATSTNPQWLAFFREARRLAALARARAAAQEAVTNQETITKKPPR